MKSCQMSVVSYFVPPDLEFFIFRLKFVEHN
jgi:hypothetical protein